MIFYEKIGLYTIFETGSTYILTQGKREIMRGTLADIKRHISENPYGTPNRRD